MTVITPNTANAATDGAQTATKSAPALAVIRIRDCTATLRPSTSYGSTTMAINTLTDKRASHCGKIPQPARRTLSTAHVQKAPCRATLSHRHFTARVAFAHQRGLISVVGMLFEYHVAAFGAMAGPLATPWPPHGHPLATLWPPPWPPSESSRSCGVSTGIPPRRSSYSASGASSESRIASKRLSTIFMTRLPGHRRTGGSATPPSGSRSRRAMPGSPDPDPRRRHPDPDVLPASGRPATGTPAP